MGRSGGRSGAIAALLLFLVSATNAFGQSGNASVSGFVQDSSQALSPGATVTATNTQTGVASELRRLRPYNLRRPGGI